MIITPQNKRIAEMNSRKGTLNPSNFSLAVNQHNIRVQKTHNAPFHNDFSEDIRMQESKTSEVNVNFNGIDNHFSGNKKLHINLGLESKISSPKSVDTSSENNETTLNYGVQTVGEIENGHLKFMNKR